MSGEKVTRSITLLPNDFNFLSWFIIVHSLHCCSSLEADEHSVFGCRLHTCKLHLSRLLQQVTTSAGFQRTITNQKCLWAKKTESLNISGLLNKLAAHISRCSKSPTVKKDFRIVWRPKKKWAAVMIVTVCSTIWFNYCSFPFPGKCELCHMVWQFKLLLFLFLARG